MGTPAQVVPEMFGVSGYGSDHLWFVGASMRGVDASYPGILTTLQAPEISSEVKEREIHNVGFEAFIEDAVASGLRWAGTHTAGDKALDLTLDAIEKGQRAGRLDAGSDSRQRACHGPLHHESTPGSDSTAAKAQYYDELLGQIY
jgi:hypothetical protein